MESLFSCLRWRKREDRSENDDKWTKENAILQCGKCKATLRGFWESPNDSEKKKNVAGGNQEVHRTQLHITIPSKNLPSERNDESSVSETDTPRSPGPRSGVASGFTNSTIFDYRPASLVRSAVRSYMPVSKDSPIYNMNNRRRGKAVIFNFAQWSNTSIPSMGLEPRLGSEKDKNDLRKCLEGMSFQVVCYDNLWRQQYDNVMQKLREEDHSDADCLLIAVMTHGEKNSIYLSDGSLIPVNSVWNEFEANACPTLAGKPKIFLIQACRGEKYDDGTRLIPETRRPQTRLFFHNDILDSGSFSYVIPNAADIFVAFSCPLGHYSWRHPERGSWFIQSLCKVFNTVGHTEELQSMLTMVAREVAVNYESNTNCYHSDKKKQVPSTSSTLIRKVFFPPKLERIFPRLMEVEL